MTHYAHMAVVISPIMKCKPARPHIRACQQAQCSTHVSVISFIMKYETFGRDYSTSKR